MSNNKIVDRIRDIVKDICDEDDTDKKEKIKRLKGYIHGNLQYGVFQINPNSGYQIRDIAADTIEELIKKTSRWNVSDYFTTFINTTIPYQSDKPFEIKEDSSTVAYRDRGTQLKKNQAAHNAAQKQAKQQAKQAKQEAERAAQITQQRAVQAAEIAQQEAAKAAALARQEADLIQKRELKK